MYQEHIAHKYSNNKRSYGASNMMFPDIHLRNAKKVICVTIINILAPGK